MLDRLIGLWSSLLSPNSPNNNENNIKSNNNSTINKGSLNGGNSSNVNQHQSTPINCLECRVIGGGGLTALGGYIIYSSFKKRNNNSGRISMFLAGFVGSVVMTLGFMRLIGVNELFEEQNSSSPSVEFSSTEKTSAATEAHAHPVTSE